MDPIPEWPEYRTSTHYDIRRMVDRKTLDTCVDGEYVFASANDVEGAEAALIERLKEEVAGKRRRK